MTGMGNVGDNINLGMGIGMRKEEMEWHLLFIVYEITGWDGLRNKQDWADDTKQELR